MWFRLAPVLLSVALVACGAPKPEPEIASSAGEASYAKGFPARVGGAVDEFGKAQLEVDALSGAYGGYRAELKGDVDGETVAEMFEQADQVGRSRAYVDNQDGLEAVRAFYADEQAELKKKVGGAAQYVAKQKGCDAEVGGAAVHALDKQMKKRLEERLREGNDAQQLLERHRESLGKDNAAALEPQLDDVARASYLAFIRMVELKVALQRFIDEGEQVRSSADATIEAEREFRAESGRSDEEKKASEQRSADMKTAVAGLDSALGSAKKMRDGMEQRITSAQKKHREALDALLADLRSK
jgi:hypothetical protein